MFAQNRRLRFHAQHHKTNSKTARAQLYDSNSNSHHFLTYETVTAPQHLTSQSKMVSSGACWSVLLKPDNVYMTMCYFTPRCGGRWLLKRRCVHEHVKVESGPHFQMGCVQDAPLLAELIRILIHNKIAWQSKEPVCANVIEHGQLFS